MPVIHLKKISTKFVGLETGLLEQIAAEQGIKKPVAVLRCYGRVRNVIDGTGQFGPWRKFEGEHECINLLTGDVYRSANILLPQQAEMVIAQVVDTVKAKDPNGVAEYGLDLTIQFKANPTGTQFMFSAAPLIEPKEEDTLTLMGKMLGAPKMLALPASKEAAVVEEEVAPKKGKK